MRLIVERHRSAYVLRAALAALLFTGGCASPPSVAPLLRVTERALLDESARLMSDAERDTVYAQQALLTLEEAYHQDLEQTQTLTHDWVREATSVYATARETLVRHRQALAQERLARADNLRSAASATRRAITLIEQQDNLLHGVVDENLRRLLTTADYPRQDSTR